MSMIPITKDKLLKERQDLKELEIKILDKFCTALELIPLPVLEQFPRFHSVSFRKLQGLRRNIKVKLHLIQTELSKFEKENEKNSESLETSGFALSKLFATPITSDVYLRHDCDKRLPKKCVNFGIRPNLRDLGLNKELGLWVEYIEQTPAISMIPVTKDNFLERRQDLKKLQIEILDKFRTALELIPLSVLKQFPKFHSVSFKKLQGLRQQVKAKLHLIQIELSKFEKENEKNSKSLEQDSDMVTDMKMEEYVNVKESVTNLGSTSVVKSPGTVPKKSIRQGFITKVETLRQELKQLPASGENCNININDNFTEISTRKLNDISDVPTVSAVTKKLDGKIMELQNRYYAELMTVTSRGIAGTMVSASSIMNRVADRAMSQRLPEIEEAILQIPHVINASVVEYGKALLNIPQKFAAEITVLMNENDEEQNNSDGDNKNSSYSYANSSTNSFGTKRKTANKTKSTSKKYKKIKRWLEIM